MKIVRRFVVIKPLDNSETLLDELEGVTKGWDHVRHVVSYPNGSTLVMMERPWREGDA